MKRRTFTKILVTVVMAASLIDMQLSYILAFMGKEQIAESLSERIAEVIIGVALGYFLKALFETKFEEDIKLTRDLHDSEGGNDESITG